MLGQRLSGTSGFDAKYFGMKQGNHHVINNGGAILLLKLGAELRQLSTRIPKSFDGSPVVKTYFGSYLHNVVAADHLSI